MKYSKALPLAIISLCLWLTLLFPYGVLAKNETGTINIQFPHLQVRGIEQSALKPGDEFSLYISGITLTKKATADMRQLGLTNSEPLTSDTGSYYSQTFTLPAGIPDGSHTIYVHGFDLLGAPVVLARTVTVDTVAPTGSLTATFTKNAGSSGEWTAHVQGAFDGTDTAGRIVNERTYLLSSDGTRTDGGYTSAADIILDATSTYAYDLPMIPPDVDAIAVGYVVTVADEAGNVTEVSSGPFPLIRSSVPLIDHAVGGSEVEPSNYVPSGIPSGVGIPYSRISGLSSGDYYAVVFFEQGGCPDGNYTINAFIPGQIWGVGSGIPGNPYAHAAGTSGGGCMERFHIDATKGSEWLWGALNPNMIAPVIADASGTPAFAICDSKSVCDAVRVHDVETDPSPLPGISNVLFLPGIKGSNLYRADQKLWLPPDNLVVPQLYLDQDGQSANDDIYAKDGDLLTQAFGQKFTQSFVDEMDAAETNGTYGAEWRWKPVAYDWRLSPEDVVRSGVQQGDRIYYEQSSSTPYIQEQLNQLAASSKTGKVTIIAYSNGGLVAKALMQKLGDAQTKALIDKVVFVDVPQTGAPRAVGALLFGDKEGIPGIAHLPDLIMTPASARTFAHDSPMAYDLLPSEQYLADTPDTNHPIVSFIGTHLWQAEKTAYGSLIANAQGLKDFLLARDGGRTEPAESDLRTPAVLSSNLLARAQSDHGQLDTWVPPDGLRVYEITGWGADTISGYQLYEQQKSLLGIPTNDYQPEYKPVFVEDGDGTVPVQSALATAASNDVWRYWLNLRGTGYTHGSILELPSLQALLGDLIEGGDDIPSDVLTAQPDLTDRTKHLYFYLHGTGDLWLCDSYGACTGYWKDAEQDSIPGSSHGSVGTVSYVQVPADSKYSLRIGGTATDSVSLDIEEHVAGNASATTTIADIPLTREGLAQLSIENGISDASVLTSDTDGDGVIDYRAQPLASGIAYAQPISDQNEGDQSGGKGANDASSASTTPPNHTVSSVMQTRSTAMNTIVLATTTEARIAATSSGTVITPRVNPVPPQEQSITPPKATITHRSTTQESNLIAAVPENALRRLWHSLWELVMRCVHAVLRIIDAS